MAFVLYFIGLKKKKKQSNIQVTRKRNIGPKIHVLPVLCKIRQAYLSFASDNMLEYALIYSLIIDRHILIWQKLQGCENQDMFYDFCRAFLSFSWIWTFNLWRCRRLRIGNNKLFVVVVVAQSLEAYIECFNMFQCDKRHTPTDAFRATYSTSVPPSTIRPNVA